MDAHRCHIPSPASSGFAILEILIATILLAATFSMAAMLSMVSSRSMVSTEARGNEQSLIESDIAAIQNLAETFTWCSGAGGFEASCPSQTARSENYYFPPTAGAVPTVAERQRIENFVGACNNTASDTLNTVLVAAIVARTNLDGTGITRNVTSDDIATNRLRITYTGANANRLVVLVPTVAAWCP